MNSYMSGAVVKSQPSHSPIYINTKSALVKVANLRLATRSGALVQVSGPVGTGGLYMRFDFFVVVGDIEVTGYQEDNFSHRESHTGEPVYGKEETIITEAIDQASPIGCSDKLDVDALMADKEFMSTLENAIANNECSSYEERFGI